MNPSPSRSGAAQPTRRHFLRQAAAGTAVIATPSLFKTPVYGQNQAPASGRVPGANERLVVAVIGLGRGKAHVGSYLSIKNVDVGYVCDVDSDRVGAILEALEGKEQSGRKDGGYNLSAVVKESGASDRARLAKGVADFRRILDDKQVDAISIAAPNHWHAIAAVLGCAAGKHVYVEKPGSHNPFEAELLLAAAAKHRRVVQMGNQRRSYSNLIEGMQKLHRGAIGRLTFARAWYN